MNDTLWDVIKKEFTRPGELPNILDYIAVESILLLSVKGYSNTYISNKLEIGGDYVKNVLVEFLHFPGWLNDLDVNPLKIFVKAKNNFIYYSNQCTLTSSSITERQILDSYNACYLYNKIRKEVDSYYDRS